MSSAQSDVGRQSKVVVIGIVVTCLTLGYIVITWFGNGLNKPSQISAMQTVGRGTTTKESEHYSQVLNRYNRAKASSAEQTGESYLSVLSNRTNNVAEQPASQSQAQPQSQHSQQQVVYYQQMAPQNASQDQQRAKEIADQTAGLMSNWSPVAHTTARVSSDGVDYASSITRMVDRTADSLQTQQSNAAALATIKIIEDFALIPALLDTDIDTDENSMVTAHIPSGQYAGAKVFAMGYKRLTNTVDMTFTFMKWQGRSYKITAKAVDQISMRTALSGEVNNRYFSRIILPAIAMGIGRAGQLYEQASAQNIVTPQGGVIQTYPSTPSATAVGSTILGGIANQAGQVLANDAANLPAKQVLIARDTTIGIQFIGPVLASDDVAVSASGPGQQNPDISALSQPSQQLQRQNSQLAPQRFGNGYGQSNAAPEHASHNNMGNQAMATIPAI
jgi:intracellular multiplication protein IcmE